MDNIDLLQIKIEKAKAELSDDTLNAINAIDWKTAILHLREEKGYTFEQLGDLETETELVLCGLLSPKDYSKELASRMKISKPQADELVEEMNKQVFSRIKEELIKNTERKKIFVQKTPTTETPVLNGFIRPVSQNNDEVKNINTEVLGRHGIEIVGEPTHTEAGVLPVPEKLELANKEKVSSILSQKFAGVVSIPSVKTEHTLPNLSPTNVPTPPKAAVTKGAVDPYREIPE